MTETTQKADLSAQATSRMDWAQQAIAKYDWHCLALNLAALAIAVVAFSGSLALRGSELVVGMIGGLVVLFTLWMVSSYYQHLKNLYVEAYRHLEAGEEPDKVSLVQQPSMRQALHQALWQPPVSWLFAVLIMALAIRSLLVL